MGALRKALAVAGLSLVTALALAGVGLSALVAWARTPAGRTQVASAAVGLVDRALAGRFHLGGLTVLSGGGVEIRDLEVFDPDDVLVLSVTRARVEADVTRLRGGTVALTVELDGPYVMLDEEADGGLSLLRAFAPARTAPGPSPGKPAWEPSLTIRVNRLTVRGGAAWWRDRRGETVLEARDVSIDARGGLGPREADLDLRLAATVDAPVQAPLSVEARASRRGAAVLLPALRASIGATTLSAVGEGDLDIRTGRLAVTRLALGREQACALLARAGGGDDLAAAAFAASDGSLATAALSFSPASARGAAEIAVAARIDGSRAAGLDVAVSGLDPSRVLDTLPPGALTLTVRGAAGGDSLDDLRGRLEAHLGRSTLRGVELGPADVRARAADGEVEIAQLALTAPGVNLEASGRARRGGALEGRAVLDGSDLAAASGAAGALLGQPVPAMTGSLRLGATLRGTKGAPEVEAALASPSVKVERVALQQLSGTFSAGGPRGARRGAFEMTVGSLRADGREVARGLSARGSLADGEASVDASGSVPALGAERVSATALGRLDAAEERFALAALGISWPGVRWSLDAPAEIDLTGPSVDRLDLASGEEHVVVGGGLGTGGRTLDASVKVVKLDLVHLPPGLLPPGMAGRVDLDGRARGPVGRPSVEARFGIEGGAAAGLSGLSATAELGWDGESRRGRLSLEALRKEGGRVEVSGELPLPLAGRTEEPLALRVNATALPLAEVLAAVLGEDLGIDGRVGLDARVGGTVGAPSLHAGGTLAEGAWGDFSGLEGSLEVDAPGDRLSVTASLSVEGRRALELEAGAPHDLGEVLGRPGPTAAALLHAPLTATAAVPALELSALAATPGLPRDLTGIVDALAEIGGSLAAPRGTVSAQVSRMGLAGYQDVAGKAEVRLLADRVEGALDATIAGADLLRATGSLVGAPEALARPGALARAPLRLEAVVPQVDLARASSASVALAGTVEVRASASGTPGEPVLRVAGSGAGLFVGGRSLGALEANGKHEKGRTTASLALRPATGGALSVTATLDTSIGLGTRTDLAVAPLDARLLAEALDVGFVPAVAPGVVRLAEGKVSADMTARGPLGRPHLLGRARLDGGRVAVAEYGDWTAIGADLEVNDDALELRKLEARRGRGRFSATGSVRGLAGESARVQASASFDGLTVARAGMDLATLALRLDADGTYRASGLDLEVRMRDRGTVTLPKRIPRTLQSLDRRSDVAVGRVRERRRPAPAAAVAGGAASAPFRTAVHLVVPGRLVVKGDEPKVDLELAADVRYEIAGGEERVTGEVVTARGFVEPMGGRRFQVVHGRVQFTGGPPGTALVDVEAHWNGAQDVEVTVVVSGPAANPQIKLSSKPAYDDSQIALLIATGRTELKRGGAEVGSLTTQDAGYAAASALVTKSFKTLIADKLPFDSFSVDSKTVRAGTYLGRIYVGYVYRFDAKVEAGENQNEWSAEYSITRGWTLESRYGDAGSGSASLMWSKDY